MNIIRFDSSPLKKAEVEAQSSLKWNSSATLFKYIQWISHWFNILVFALILVYLTHFSICFLKMPSVFLTVNRDTSRCCQ